MIQHLHRLWLYIIIHFLLQVDLRFALSPHFLELLIGPSHLNEVLLTLEVSDVLQNILGQLLALIDGVLVPLLILDGLEVESHFTQHIVEHHLCEVISIVVHHSATHLGEHADLARVRAEASMGGPGELYVPLSLLNLLKHWLKLVG